MISSICISILLSLHFLFLLRPPTLSVLTPTPTQPHLGQNPLLYLHLKKHFFFQSTYFINLLGLLAYLTLRNILPVTLSGMREMQKATGKIKVRRSEKDLKIKLSINFAKHIFCSSSYKLVCSFPINWWRCL